MATDPDPETPKKRAPRTTIRDLGPQGAALYRAMVNHGDDARSLARAVGVHETTPGKWLRGARPLRPMVQTLIARYPELTASTFGYAERD